MKKTKMNKFIEAELESESELELVSDIELKLNLALNNCRNKLFEGAV